MKEQLLQTTREVHVARQIHRGAYRTAIGYVVFVMGGAFLVVFPAISLLAILQDRSYGYPHPNAFAVLALDLKIFLRLLGSLVVVIWFLAGTLLYVCALGLQKLKIRLLPRLILAGISAYLSFKILIVLAPTGWPSLQAVMLTMFGTGLVGALFGFFVYPRTCDESFQTAPLWRGHRVVFSAWALLIIVGYGYTAYAMHRVHSFNDPVLDLVFVKWSPGEGEVREKPNGTGLTYMRDVEIEELRAAGLTGTLLGWGSSTPGSGQKSRVVIIMSRGVRETIDLPKPAIGDILYIQTHEGWKAFPSSTPTLPRTIRLNFSEPNEHSTSPYTTLTTDRGLGHVKPEYGLNAFSWTQQEFQAPLPSLSAQNTNPQ